MDVRIAITMIAVDDQRRLAECAALADDDRRRALDQHVGCEEGTWADLHAPVAKDVASESAPEVDVWANDERPRVRDIEAESRPDPHGAKELHGAMAVRCLNEEFPNAGREAFAPEVSQLPGQLPSTASQHIREV
jgi:hypothetical protein